MGGAEHGLSGVWAQSGAERKCGEGIQWGAGEGGAEDTRGQLGSSVLLPIKECDVPVGKHRQGIVFLLPIMCLCVRASVCVFL